MKKIKNSLIVVLLIFSTKFYSQAIANNDISFVVAEDNLQTHNEPYKFYIEFKTRVPNGNPEYFIATVRYYSISVYGQDQFWSNVDYFVDAVANGDKETIGGYDVYTYRSKLIDLSDAIFQGQSFPVGNYKLSIVGRIPDQGHMPVAYFDSNGDPISGITNGVKVFNINDICSDCNNGIFLDTDTDGDGVYDKEDNCPNEAGPTSNDGCPGNADLTFDLENSIYDVSNCNYDCSSSFESISGTPTVFTDSELEIELTLENIGEADYSAGDDVNIKIYASLDETLEIGTAKDVEIDSYTFGNLRTGAGETQGVPSFEIDFTQLKAANRLVWVAGTTATTTINAGYIICVIESEEPNEDNEVDTTNNTFAFRYFHQEVASFSARSVATEEPYLLQIYNSSFKLIINEVVNNYEEEKAIIGLLDSGFYIMNSNNEKSKFYKK